MLAKEFNARARKEDEDINAANEHKCKQAATKPSQGPQKHSFYTPAPCLEIAIQGPAREQVGLNCKQNSKQDAR